MFDVFNTQLGNLAGAGDPKELYKEQNKQLKDMGFINEELNFQVLAQTYGNVDAAVERLLNMMNWRTYFIQRLELICF